MAPTLLTLPLEIRHAIYSYILLDKNVTHTKPGSTKRQFSKYETGLFLVSKSLSAETLHFFYSQNAFINIDTNMIWNLKGCQRAMPIFLGPKAKSFKHYILKMKLELIVESVEDDMAEKDPPYAERETAIISARHLAKFMHLLNSDLTDEGRDSDDWDRSELTLTFCSTGCHFQNKPKAVEIVVHGLKGIYASTVPRYDDFKLTYWGHGLREIAVRPYESTLLLKIEGDLDEEQQKVIKNATIPNYPTVAESIILIRTVLENGDTYVKQGDYTTARGEYAVAYSLAGNLLLLNKHDEILDASEENLTQKLLILALDIRLAISTVNTLQQYHKSAIYMAENAWLLVKRGRLEISTPEMHAKIHYRLGLARAANGELGEAVLALIDAVRFTPGNSEMVAKLIEIKKLHQSHARGDRAHRRRVLYAQIRTHTV